MRRGARQRGAWFSPPRLSYMETVEPYQMEDPHSAAGIVGAGRVRAAVSLVAGVIAAEGLHQAEGVASGGVRGSVVPFLGRHELLAFAAHQFGTRLGPRVQLAPRAGELGLARGLRGARPGFILGLSLVLV